MVAPKLVLQGATQLEVDILQALFNALPVGLSASLSANRYETCAPDARLEIEWGDKRDGR